MRCDKVRELLLTDYIDHEMEPGRKEMVDRHLSSCAECSSFLKEVVKTSSEPFKGIPELEAPAFIWERIKGEIDSGIRAPRGIWGRFGAAAWFPPIGKTAIAAAMGVLLVVLSVTVTRNTGKINTVPGEYAAISATKNAAEGDPFFAYLYDGFEEKENESAGLGTAVEEFFL